MEYRAIWLIFFAVLSVMGGAVSVTPKKVIGVLRQAPTVPEDWAVLGFRVIGCFVAIIAIAEFISIVTRGRLL